MNRRRLEAFGEVVILEVKEKGEKEAKKNIKRLSKILSQYND